MITLCSNTESGYYALEELHDAVGVVTNEQIVFKVGDKQTNLFRQRGQGFKYVYFCPIKKDDSIPQVIETYINGEILYVRTDILGCILRELSRTEELNKPKDKYGRFPLEESSAFKQGVYQTAYLDHLISQFKKRFVEYLNLKGISWKEEIPSHEKLVCLTHDVDSIKGKSFTRYAFWIAKAFLSLKVTKIRETINQINLYKSLESDPHFSFQSLCDIEKSFGFTSTFFLMSLPFFLGREGRRYTLYHSDLKRTICKLSKSGWELGLHPSRSTYLSKGKLEKEMNRFTSHLGGTNASLGIRNHYLRASFPETWRIQEELGILYDSSLGWTEEPGFRAGTSRPFRPFNIKRNRRLNIWELPLIVMDGTLSGTCDDINKKCLKMADEAFKYNAPFTILWHTDRISRVEYPEFAKAYVKLLNYFKEKKCIGTTAANIIKVYEAHSRRMSLHRRRFE